MIYVASGAFVKFIKREEDSEALRSCAVSSPPAPNWRRASWPFLETTRTLLRAGVDHQRVPSVAGQALRGLYLLDLSSAVLARAKGYRPRELGSLDAVHLATAEPFRAELTDFVTHDSELAAAATGLGLPVRSPS